MRKNYFLTLLLTLFFGAVFSQDLVITGVIDGPLPGGAPKGIELYVVNDIADLSIYGLESTTNGAAAAGAEYTFPTDAVTAGTYIYVASESTNFNQYLGVVPQYTNNVVSVNGDDTIILYKNGNVEDTIGRIGEDGTGQDWDHLDGWAYRKDGQGPNANFDPTEWTFSGANALDGCDKADDSGTNAECSSVFPVGTYSKAASTDPEISTGGSVSSLDYFEGNGPSAGGSFTVSGSNLTNDITVTAPANFEVSLTVDSGYANNVTLAHAGGTVNATTVYVRLAAGLGVNSYNGDVTLSSTGATNKTLAVSGTVSPADPQMTVTAFLDDMNYIESAGGPSNEESFTVEGLFLTSDITVTAPANFEVSLASGSGFANSVNITPAAGTVATTTVYVRLADGLAVANYQGNITVTATGVTDETIAVNGNVYGAPTNSLVITGVFDATLSGGTPKGIELYVVNDIADLSLFGISSITNGAGSSAGTVEYTFPADAVSAGTYIYLATESTNFNTFFGFDPTYTSGVVSINGDDSIELYESGQIIDTFGDVDTDGTGEAWDYLDGWAYRKGGTGPEGTTFTVTNWTYSGADAFDGEATNAAAATPFPNRTYAATASVDRNNIEGFAVYPNPTNNKTFNVTTATFTNKEVHIFNMIGKEVFTQTIEGTTNEVNVGVLTTGIYFLKVVEAGKIATKKLVVK
ncbi:T9SS type A sorting domain-containing protein [Tenacibaculum amylolyticum]|uniref:T9SS type A sorting domain-containing protein n=1 Tax=Tenacibaculum amylolyticum TaxID=104269 RepID=UPI0038956C9C